MGGASLGVVVVHTAGFVPIAVESWESLFFSVRTMGIRLGARENAPERQ